MEEPVNIRSIPVLNDLSNNDGWENDAESTLLRWQKSLKYTSFCYQFVLDRNLQISNTLNILATVISLILGIFSGFKLWQEDDKQFQSASNIIMLISNSIVAGLTTISKKYIDDGRNEKIKKFVDEVDKFNSMVNSQLLLSKKYRISADDFFKENTPIFSKIMSDTPSLTIKEIQLIKKSWTQFEKDNVWSEI